MKDYVKVTDQLEIFSSNGEYRLAPPVEDDIVPIVGFFSCFLRERGKIVPFSRREGKNIWTLTGREHLAQLQSYSSYSPLTPARNDRLRYIGFGTGTQPEVSTVTELVTPIAFNGSDEFLAQTAIATYPLLPSKTTSRYTRTYTETELSVVGSVTLSEAGIFTDGDPVSFYEPATRDISLLNAAAQAPNGYKAFEPLLKTQNFTFEAAWEVRFGG